MAFIFIMLTFTAIFARYRAAEMVLVLHLLTIFGFLCALQLEHACTLCNTVGCLAGSTLIVRRTTVEKILGALYPWRGGCQSYVSTARHGPSDG